MYDILKKALDDALTESYAAELENAPPAGMELSYDLDKKMRQLIKLTDKPIYRYTGYMAAAACAFIAIGAALIIPQAMRGEIDTKPPETSLTSEAPVSSDTETQSSDTPSPDVSVTAQATDSGGILEESGSSTVSESFTETTVTPEDSSASQQTSVSSEDIPSQTRPPETVTAVYEVSESTSAPAVQNGGTPTESTFVEAPVDDAPAPDEYIYTYDRKELPYGIAFIRERKEEAAPSETRSDTRYDLTFFDPEDEPDDETPDVDDGFGHDTSETVNDAEPITDEAEEAEEEEEIADYDYDEEAIVDDEPADHDDGSVVIDGEPVDLDDEPIVPADEQADLPAEIVVDGSDADITIEEAVADNGSTDVLSSGVPSTEVGIRENVLKAGSSLAGTVTDNFGISYSRLTPLDAVYKEDHSDDDGIGFYTDSWYEFDFVRDFVSFIGEAAPTDSISYNVFQPYAVIDITDLEDKYIKSDEPTESWLDYELYICAYIYQGGYIELKSIFYYGDEGKYPYYTYSGYFKTDEAETGRFLKRLSELSKLYQ